MKLIIQIIGVLLGIVAFGILILFEVLKCKSKREGRQSKNPLFIIGTVLLLIGWILEIVMSRKTGMAIFCIGAVFTVAGVILYIVVLMATSKGGTYTENSNEAQVCRNGIYNIIRHPGLWCFWIVSAGISLMFPESTAASVIFAVLNTVYIILQDMLFFPVYIQGYTVYKMEVPFCFPHIGGTGRSR